MMRRYSQGGASGAIADAEEGVVPKTELAVSSAFEVVLGPVIDCETLASENCLADVATFRASVRSHHHANNGDSPMHMEAISLMTTMDAHFRAGDREKLKCLLFGSAKFPYLNNELVIMLSDPDGGLMKFINNGVVPAIGALLRCASGDEVAFARAVNAIYEDNADGATAILPREFACSMVFEALPIETDPSVVVKFFVSALCLLSCGANWTKGADGEVRLNIVGEMARGWRDRAGLYYVAEVQEEVKKCRAILHKAGYDSDVLDDIQDLLAPVPLKLNSPVAQAIAQARSGVSALQLSMGSGGAQCTLLGHATTAERLNGVMCVIHAMGYAAEGFFGGFQGAARDLRRGFVGSILSRGCSYYYVNHEDRVCALEYIAGFFSGAADTDAAVDCMCLMCYTFSRCCKASDAEKTIPTFCEHLLTFAAKHQMTFKDVYEAVTRSMDMPDYCNKKKERGWDDIDACYIMLSLLSGLVTILDPEDFAYLSARMETAVTQKQQRPPRQPTPPVSSSIYDVDCTEVEATGPQIGGI
jgi:hypothetical protein